MRPGGRGHRGIGLGVLLLGFELLRAGSEYFPPVTMVLTALQAALFLGILNPPWSSTDVCLSAGKVLLFGDYRCLLLAPIEHSSDMHLYYNMSSLLWKGRQLERRLGWRQFLVLVTLLTVGTSLCYVGLMEAAAQNFDPSYRTQCAIGFSGVLFAMKVLNTHHDSRGYGTRSSSHLMGLHISVPTQYAVWVELLVIHFLVPRSSFAGHLAGILVGLACTSIGYESIIHTIDSWIMYLFRGPSYTYARGSVGRGGGGGDDSRRRVGRGSPSRNPDPPMHFSQPEEQYTTYNRNDFNPSRDFDPIFDGQRRTRSRGATTPPNPSYTYASGTPGGGPSAPPMGNDWHLSPEELRQQRLRRFE